MRLNWINIVLLVGSWIQETPYEPDIVTEYFSQAKHTRTLAEWCPKRRLHVPVG